MIKRIVVITSLLSFSVLLHGMDRLKRSKTVNTEKPKSNQAYSLYDSAPTPLTKNGKVSIKSLAHVDHLKTAQEMHRQRSLSSDERSYEKREESKQKSNCSEKK